MLKSGTNRNFNPSIAPSKKSPLMLRIKKDMKGKVAVTTTIFPDVLTPFLKIR